MPDRKIVVIGDEDAVFGLGLIGITGRAAATVEEAREAIRNAMADPDIALILLTEDLWEAQPESRDESGALIVHIPSRRAEKPAIALEAQIKSALGIHLEP
jgi:vacuolar-type H+-ATPase subunit F/Vma7